MKRQAKPIGNLSRACNAIPLLIIVLVTIIGFSMAGCDNGAANEPTGEDPIVIDIAAIQGVTPPATGATPVTAITPTAQYTGTVTWNPAHTTFEASTAYTAKITLTAQEGFTLTGVEANFFTVAGTTTAATNDANSGVITAVFPNTGNGNGDGLEAMSGKTALQYFTDNNIKAGWNLGNTLDAVNIPAKATETAWGNPAATQQLFNGVKDSGFDIVRIPCTWIGYIGPAPDYIIDEARLKRVADVIGYAKTAGIKAMIINIHHDGNNTAGNNTTWGFVDMPAAVNNAAKKAEIQEQISKVWTQIAEYFKNYGDYLIFETLNEVHNGNWGNGASNKEQDILFDWNQAALNAIRATGGNNAERFVAVPGLGSTEPDIAIAANNRSKLLPNDGSNGTKKLVVSIHYYAPAQYTVADVTDQAWQLIHTWGTTAEINSLKHEMELLKTNFIDKGIAVYIGEWGAPTDVRSSMNQTIKDTHINYIKSVATAARLNSVLPIYWDDGGYFKMLERSNGKPKTGFWKNVLDTMIDAINNPKPLDPGTTPTPNTITGNMGQYNFGLQEDGVTPNYTLAIWGLSETNLTTVKQSGAQLVLELNAAPSSSMQLVWQGPTYEIWWKSADILGNTGNVLDTGKATWNAGTKTLTINLAAALDDYSSFTVQPSLNIIVAYYGGASINDLGIISANLVGP